MKAIKEIISYKELVNAVKNRTEDVYEDELESQPLATVSDLMEELEILTSMMMITMIFLLHIKLLVARLAMYSVRTQRLKRHMDCREISTMEQLMVLFL